MSNVSNYQIKLARSGVMKTRVGTYLRTNVHSATFPVGFSSQLGTNLGVFIEGHVLGDELSFLGNHVDVEGNRTVELGLSSAKHTMQM